MKYFCDGCGDEITTRNQTSGGSTVESRLGTTVQKVGHKLKVEVMLTMNGTCNDGCWCKYCVLDALQKLDDRPKSCHQAQRVNA